MGELLRRQMPDGHGQGVPRGEDAGRQFGEHIGTMTALIDFYVTDLRRGDQFQREFEQAVGEHIAPDGAMAEVVEQARRRYGTLMGKLQPIFTSQLETAGWPPAGRLTNAVVFDRHVAPLLKENGRRGPFIIVDALH